MSENILIRCDASSEIGLGHVTRCLVLASQFKELGHYVVFAMKNYPLGLEKVKEENFKIDVLTDWNLDYDSWLQSCIENHSINIFIGDVRDGLPIDSIIKMKNKGVLTIAIDEPSDYRRGCDLCFYPPIDSVNNLDWKNFTGKIYKGFEYIILRDEFYKPFTKTKNIIPNILVMMGGVDNNNLTFSVLKLLEKNGQDFNVQVILNKNHINYKDIQKHILTSKKNIKLYTNVKNMSNLLDQIDFGIISFGVSAYELLAKNIAAVHICLNEEHWKASGFFQERKFAQRIQKDKLDLFLNLIKFDSTIEKNIMRGCNVIQTILKASHNTL